MSMKPKKPKKTPGRKPHTKNKEGFGDWLRKIAGDTQ